MSTLRTQQHPYSVTAAGAVLPFEAGATGEAPPSDLEMQGFWNVLKKIAQGVQTGINVGQQLGMSGAGAPGPAAQVPPSDLEMQSFWNVLKKQTPWTKKPWGDLGKPPVFLPFEAGPTAEAPPSDLEMQGFWNVLKKIAQGTQAGLTMGKSLGLFEIGTPGATAQARPDVEVAFLPPTLTQIQQWLKTFKERQTQGVGTGLNIGKPLGVLEAGMPVAAAEAPADLEMAIAQGFWNALKNNKLQQLIKELKERETRQGGKPLGVLEAGMPVAAAEAPADLEMQGFWSVLKKLGQGVGTGLDIGKSPGLFQRAPIASSGVGPSQEQLLTLLQQALPALQAIAQQAQLAPQTIMGPTPGFQGSGWLSKFQPRPVSSLIL
jgi:hypothetical protein